MTILDIPLFPLNTVLFPGGPLPLRIFESRYIDMVSHCMKNDAPFGVVLISDGEETGPSTFHDVGTLARITDWYQGSDGLLGITAIGEQRFRVGSMRRQEDGLNVGTVELMEPEPGQEVPEELQALANILENVLDDLGRLYESLPRDPDNAVWLSYRFIEILPIDLEQKQRCLESSDTLARLRLVDEILHTVQD